MAALFLAFAFFSDLVIFIGFWERLRW